MLEGYTDKKILKLFITGTNWKDYGLCYTGGVTNIEYVISILDLGSREYFVLSDADEVAKRNKRKMGNPEYWYTYEDLGSQSISIEDFYKVDFFQKIVIEVLQENDIDGTEDELFQEDDRIKSINNFLKRKQRDNNEIDNATIKKMIDAIKKKCIQKFKKNDIDKEKVINVLNTFSEKINTN